MFDDGIFDDQPSARTAPVHRPEPTGNRHMKGILSMEATINTSGAAAEDVDTLAGDSAPAQVTEQRTGKGSAKTRPIRRGRRPRLPKVAIDRLNEHLLRFSEELMKDPILSDYVKRDKQGFRIEACLLLKRQFPLRIGRPTDPWLDEAYAKVMSGASVPSILRERFPNWDEMDCDLRALASKGLHSALNRRRANRTRRAGRTRRDHRTK